jgi:hypothetical protein
MKKEMFQKLVIGALVALVTFLPVAGLGSVSSAGFAQSKDIRIALPSAARTAATGNGNTIGVGDDDTCIAYLKVTARTGGTLDVKLQDSPDGSSWYDITGGAFSQVSSSTAELSISVSRNFGKYIRAYWAIGGGGGFTFSVTTQTYKGNPLVIATTDANAANLTTGTLPNARLVNVAASNLNEDVARTVTVNLAAADIIAMGTTPVSLIAAPGAGKITLVESITLKMVRTATAFTGGGALEFRYTDASGAKVTADIAASVVTTGGAGTEYNSVAGVTTSLTPVANAAIVIRNATAAFADGTGTATVTLKYRVITP